MLVPTKQKHFSNKKSYFITKERQKALMTRLKLLNEFLKTKSQEC